MPTVSAAASPRCRGGASGAPGTLVARADADQPGVGGRCHGAAHPPGPRRRRLVGPLGAHLAEGGQRGGLAGHLLAGGRGCGGERAQCLGQPFGAVAGRRVDSLQ
ncbi:hypothetical protein D3C59_15675 [Streptomyces sp. SHP22-7]|nr:hypothetical protein D3C59_15675 [Streptomyces sp. SHP22-7]